MPSYLIPGQGQISSRHTPPAVQRLVTHCNEKGADHRGTVEVGAGFGDAASVAASEVEPWRVALRSHHGKQ